MTVDCQSIKWQIAICGNSSVGRAQPCQGWGRQFESGFPLQTGDMEPRLYAGAFLSARRVCLYPLAGWQSGYAAACKAVDAGSIPASASIFFSTSIISHCRIPLRCLARVAKLVDARDLKSLGFTAVPVRFRPRAPIFLSLTAHDPWPAVMYGLCQAFNPLSLWSGRTNGCDLRGLFP